jgi:integrase
LSWSDINLVRGYIQIDARNSKTAQRRLIGISENLAEWLKPCLTNSEGPLWKKSVTQFHVAVRNLHIATGVQRKDNALRHSFGSYHLALYQDAPKTAHQIGHQSPAVLYEHYREVTSPEAAQRYWNICPQHPPANLVAFERQEAACA